MLRNTSAIDHRVSRINRLYYSLKFIARDFSTSLLTAVQFTSKSEPIAVSGFRYHIVSSIVAQSILWDTFSGAYKTRSFNTEKTFLFRFMYRPTPQQIRKNNCLLVFKSLVDWAFSRATEKFLLLNPIKLNMPRQRFVKRPGQSATLLLTAGL